MIDWVHFLLLLFVIGGFANGYFIWFSVIDKSKDTSETLTRILQLLEEGRGAPVAQP